MKYRVLFHLDEDNQPRITMTLNNIKNLLADLGTENVQVELVVNGEGVRAFVKPSENQTQITALAAVGVRFALCANSLRGLNLHERDLLEQAEIVPAGVSELARKQAEGWAYIRP